MKHLLDIETLETADIHAILARTAEMKLLRGPHPDAPLAGECWAIMFAKSSTRTRSYICNGIVRIKFLQFWKMYSPGLPSSSNDIR